MLAADDAAEAVGVDVARGAGSGADAHAGKPARVDAPTNRTIFRIGKDSSGVIRGLAIPHLDDGRNRAD